MQQDVDAWEREIAAAARAFTFVRTIQTWYWCWGGSGCMRVIVLAAPGTGIPTIILMPMTSVLQAQTR